MMWLPGMESEQRSRDLSQFYTPPELAGRMWWFASAALPWPWPFPVSVLEPACGRGALIQALKGFGGLPIGSITAFDLDPANVAWCASNAASFPPGCIIRTADFMALDERDALGRYDVCVMNPPFEAYDQGADFVERVCGCSDLTIALLPSRVEHFRVEFWRWHDIRRKAILSDRPVFGGIKGMTDFSVYDVVRRKFARKQGEATTCAIEYW